MPAMSRRRSATAEASTIVDAVPPTSTVAPLPAITNTTTFTFRGPGTIIWAAPELPTTVFLSQTMAVRLCRIPERDHRDFYQLHRSAGQHYRFYSIATDNVGNHQATPATAQATTLIQAISTVLLSSEYPSGSAYGQTSPSRPTLTPAFRQPEILRGRYSS